MHEHCTFAKIIMQKYKLYTHLGKYNLQMFSEWEILFLNTLHHVQMDWK